MTDPKGTIPTSYDVDTMPDPEFDPDLIAQAAEESFPEEEYVPTAMKSGEPIGQRLDGTPEYPDYLDPAGVGSTGAPDLE